MSSKRTGPRWDTLFETSVEQEGHFTTAQAAAAGFSPQLLTKHLKAGRIRRVRRGIYRMVHYPAGDNEDLVVCWLWSNREGLFSHETALALHDLSDALPAVIHMTLPMSWASRRLRVPDGTVLHHADIPGEDRTWLASVPLTTPARTLLDCAAESAPPDLVRQAYDEGRHRGLFARDEVWAVREYIEPYERGSR